jgi:hypothetical protein
MRFGFNYNNKYRYKLLIQIDFRFALLISFLFFVSYYITPKLKLILNPSPLNIVRVVFDFNF